MFKRSFHRLLHHKLFYGLAALLIIAAGILYYFYSYKSNHSPNKIVTAGTPTATAQATTSKPAQKNLNTSSGNLNAGGATDTHGTSSSSTNSSQWTTSASGVITVKSPAPNATLKSGDIISGSSSASTVNYRLSDNKVGVVAQGTLSVDQGNFSGILHFQSQGSGGRLDVFTTNSMGVEYNEVQINVSF